MSVLCVREKQIEFNFDMKINRENGPKDQKTPERKDKRPDKYLS